MRGVLADAIHRTKTQVKRDLAEDPGLRYVLLVALLLAVFWIWHRLPNFATRDERWRIVDSFEVLAALEEEFSFESFKDGVTFWRSYGATFYVFGVATLPVVAAVLITGQTEIFVDVGRHNREYWDHWQRVPAWFWTWSLLLGRLVVVAFAVGCVYLTYRIGTAMVDRATGRLAAILLAFTWGFLLLSHEVGEDVPALFFFLLSFYFAFRYVETGEARTFYAASLAGGVATAVKLTAGVAAVVIAIAFVLRARRSDEPFPDAIDRPKLLLVGVGLGSAAILLGYPSVVVGQPDHFGSRVDRGVGNKGQAHGFLVQPSWWWMLRGYLHGVGLPLFLGFLGGVAAALPRLRERSARTDGLAMALGGTATLLAVYSTWAYVRTHHLLLTFPLLALVLAAGLSRLSDRRPTLGRAVVALLVVTSGIYATVGVAGYATQPRDQATEWLAANADESDDVETYVWDPQDAAIPHSMEDSYVPSDDLTDLPERCPEFVELNYHRTILLLAPENHSKRAAVVADAEEEAVVRDLLAEDTYPYEVAAEFGPRPRFLDGKDPHPEWWRLLRTGIYPRTNQWGDPQEMGVGQFTMILRRTGPCDAPDI